MNDLKKNTFHFWEVDIQTLWSARLHFSYESVIAFKDFSKSPALSEIEKFCQIPTEYFPIKMI